MDSDLIKIQQKVKKYHEILENTKQYRKDWHDGLKELIMKTLKNISSKTGLDAEIEVQDKVENMELIVFNLGRTTSGISEKVDETVKRPMIKSNGALIYQQLFNGKVLVMESLPHIEGYGDPRPPKTIEILRPDELKKPFIYRHMEIFLKDVTDWEDYDDDEPQQKAGFNPIGFNTQIIEEED
ncbi:hypothetical protein [Portibacter marinus]|uniref:hypothetical protein n=1 Tax=Portibacter marinus TaxID=2898660 RepID=UPI001F31AFA4|nr:hypothetical protein [Portibacter marinus]